MHLEMQMLVCSMLVSSSALVMPSRSTRNVHARSALRMVTDPGERWESYKAVVAATGAYTSQPTVDSALSLCRMAAVSREADPDVVIEALLTVEKGTRAIAKTDDGALSR